MVSSSLRVYFTTNAISCIAIMFLFPSDLSMSLVGLLASLLITSPALAFLLLGFFIIQTLCADPIVSWMIVLIMVAVCGAIPLIVTSGFKDEWFHASVTSPYISVWFAAIGLQSFYLNKYFKTLRHENN